MIEQLAFEADPVGATPEVNASLKSELVSQRGTSRAFRMVFLKPRAPVRRPHSVIVWM